MLQAFYSATIGAQQQMQRMNVQGNNIANVNTYGYKAEKPAFNALMYGTVDGVDGAELPRGSGTLMVSTATDFRASDLTETGRAQDYAVIGEGFFALYNPATEEVSYTRDGSFTLGSFQQPVLDTQGYPIVVTDPEARQPVGVFTIQYKDGLQHLGSGRFLMGEKNGQVWISESEVRQGFLESSNTDLATEMGKVIEAQRAYSYALRMVTTADEVETTIINLTN